MVLLMEAIFLSAFFSFVLLRWANPDLWHPYRGGEKPMDFAYLNAVTRSTIMPPYDPWFAGGYLNYYYFGQFIVAVLIRLTGIPPAIAYNLAIPLFFALTAGGVFTIIYALVAGTKNAEDGTGSLWGPVMAGLVGVVFVAVAGNIDGLIQVIQGAPRVLFSDQSFGTFDYWHSSRMLAPGNEITEFPFFTFLFADLHAHLIAIPIALLALGLSFTLYNGIVSGKACSQEQWAAVVALGITIGTLRITNTWDWPTQLTLASSAIIVAHMLTRYDSLLPRLRHALGMGSVVIVVSQLTALPFLRHFEFFYLGVQVSQTQTPLWRYVVIHAPFLFLILSYIGWRGKITLHLVLQRTEVPLRRVVRFTVVPLAVAAGIAFCDYATVAFVGLVMLAIAVVMVGELMILSNNSGAVPLPPHNPAVLRTAPLSIMTRFPHLPYELFVSGLMRLGLAIGAGVDVMTVNGDIGRMNTVFKFYLQAWTLLGIASAYLVWRFVSAGMFSLRGLSIGRGLWLSGVTVLCLGVLIYPVLGTPARLHDRFTASYYGLDGLAYMRDATHEEKSQSMALRYDLAAIQWLQQNVKGSPVIVEGVADPYRWGSRIAINTGLPTVVGWDWHQRQQRMKYANAVAERRRAVEEIYSTTDPRAAIRLLRKYQATYLYVGALERIQYSPAGIAKFAHMQAQGIVPVYTNDEVTIYKLTTPDLEGTAGDEQE
ncbi:MAG: DUF2298 domain-containing protein [Candidatus Binatia bacterium]